MPGGRPPIFTQDLADIICERIAEGQSLRSILRDEDMPAMGTVLRWLVVSEEFLLQYTKAREVQAETLADEMQDIADDGSNDWMARQGKDGENVGWVLNGEHVQRSRLRIETRKWIASKLKPKKYGDKLGLTDGDGGPLQIVIQRFGEDKG